MKPRSPHQAAKYPKASTIDGHLDPIIKIGPLRKCVTNSRKRDIMPMIHPRWFRKVEPWTQCEDPQ
ncbi:MAG: hypothetical protein DBW78_03320 [Rhodothermaeota bacterium MED-G64]|nr:MAG: hypothetical protein DBW78_03320 [Rhodothermaeota bacterium MED-G64]